MINVFVIIKLKQINVLSTNKVITVNPYNNKNKIKHLSKILLLY